MSWFKKEVIKKVVITRPSDSLVQPIPEEVRGWMGMGVGKYYKSTLMSMMEDLKDGWANGDYTGSTTEETVQRNSEALGKVQQLAEILLTLEEMQTDEEDTD